MLLVPDPDTAIIDPAIETPTLSVICDVEDPVTRQRYSRDPRYVATKAEQYVKDAGAGDTVYVGPELEFFIFDEVRFHSDQHSSFYSIDSDEGIWNSGEGAKLNGELNTGYRPRYKEGYFPVSPHDTQTDIRNEMVEEMERCGIEIELHHHEVATAGQGEIDMRFDTLRPPILQVYFTMSTNKCTLQLIYWTTAGACTPLDLKERENLFFGDGYGLNADVPQLHRGSPHGKSPAFCAPRRTPRFVRPKRP
jgi:hypothetical protein